MSEAKRTAWTFQLNETGGFDVSVDVENMGASKIVFRRIVIKRDKTGVKFDEEEVGQLVLPKSGKGAITIATAADEDPDTIYSAHCVAFKGVSPAEAWRWVLGVRQGQQKCPLAWGPAIVGGQCIGSEGVQDPCSGAHEFGGAEFDGSTILFDVIPPASAKGGR